MAGITRPRHARKEVRELGNWLEDHGWKYTRSDSRDHTVWTWPATGQEITLPETPRGTMWMRNTKHAALKIMGITETSKYRPKPYTPPKPNSGLVITKAHARQMLEWITACTDELVSKAELNGDNRAATLFKLYDTRLRQYITD